MRFRSTLSSCLWLIAAVFLPATLVFAQTNRSPGPNSGTAPNTGGQQPGQAAQQGQNQDWWDTYENCKEQDKRDCQAYQYVNGQPLHKGTMECRYKAPTCKINVEDARTHQKQSFEGVLSGLRCMADSCDACPEATDCANQGTHDPPSDDPMNPTPRDPKTGQKAQPTKAAQ